MGSKVGHEGGDVAVVGEVAAGVLLAVLPLTASSPASAAETLPLAEAVTRPVEAESRDGYDRDAFRHWNTGAIRPTAATPARRCCSRLSGGSGWSYCDQVWVTSASGLGIDHMVPLAESWDSGASAWTAQRREAYANDQGSATSLVAVAARSNRSKSDQDPAEWLPPAA